MARPTSAALPHTERHHVGGRTIGVSTGYPRVISRGVAGTPRSAAYSRPAGLEFMWWLHQQLGI